MPVGSFAVNSPVGFIGELRWSSEIHKGGGMVFGVHAALTGQRDADGAFVIDGSVTSETRNQEVIVTAFLATR